MIEDYIVYENEMLYHPYNLTNTKIKQLIKLHTNHICPVNLAIYKTDKHKAVIQYQETSE